MNIRATVGIQNTGATWRERGRMPRRGGHRVRKPRDIAKMMRVKEFFRAFLGR